MTTPAGRPAGRRQIGRRTLAIGLAVVTAGTLTATSASASAAPAKPAASPFGSNVTIFDPSMPVAEIQAKLDAAHAKQVNAEMGTDRYASPLAASADPATGPVAAADEPESR